MREMQEKFTENGAFMVAVAAQLSCRFRIFFFV